MAACAFSASPATFASTLACLARKLLSFTGLLDMAPTMPPPGAFRPGVPWIEPRCNPAPGSIGLFGSLLPPPRPPIGAEPGEDDIESPRESVLVRGDKCGMSAA